jgi:hypothetical protein
MTKPRATSNEIPASFGSVQGTFVQILARICRAHTASTEYVRRFQALQEYEFSLDYINPVTGKNNMRAKIEQLRMIGVFGLYNS